MTSEFIFSYALNVFDHNPKGKKRRKNMSSLRTKLEFEFSPNDFELKVQSRTKE